MEQLGCLLLGFAVAGPMVLVMTWMLLETQEPAVSKCAAPSAVCDAMGVVAFFASLSEPEANPAQPLSSAELIALLGGIDKKHPATVRFDGDDPCTSFAESFFLALPLPAPPQYFGSTMP
jgi:hypothetical protein